MVVLDREGQERVPLRHSLGENRLRSTTGAHSYGGMTCKSFRLDFPSRKVKNTPSKSAVSFFVREEGPGCELWLVAQSVRKPKVFQYRIRRIL